MARRWVAIRSRHIAAMMLIVMVLVVFRVSAKDRALLVGIGKYDKVLTGWNEIHGNQDVALLLPLLRKRGFTDIITLTDRQATKAEIVKELKALASRCRPGDRVYFHFSGHGQPIRDDNHDEGVRKPYDESIIPYDACRDTRKMGGKYEGQFHLIDDELCPLLDAIKRKLGNGGELFVAVDACYSRGIQKDETTEIDPELLRYMRGTNHAFTPRGQSSYLERVPKPKRYTPGAKMTVVTACRENERNIEYRTDDGKFYGSLSFYISLLLKGDVNFSRWRECFLREKYRGYGIFQEQQHPSIEIIR